MRCRKGIWGVVITSLLFLSCSRVENSNQVLDSYLEYATMHAEDTIMLDSTVLGTRTIISNLNVPWEITWGPDQRIWFTEQDGRVSRVNPKTGEKEILLDVAKDMTDVFTKRTPGLLGMALHPEFSDYPFVFLNYQYKSENKDKDSSKLVRYTFKKDTLIDPLVLYEIPRGSGHNGARVTIAPDGKVMWSTGDAHMGEASQNVNSPNGKVLRLNIDGSIPEDNPFPNNPVWAWGLRNPQGLIYSSAGNLYVSDHGDATDDEVNKIEKEGNYGWPEVRGYADTPKEKSYVNDSIITMPLRAWTPTIAPAGIDYYDFDLIPEWQNSILLTTLKENDLRILKLDQKGGKVISEQIYLDNKFGRIRDVSVSPDGIVYVSTSNRDWNPGEGYPKEQDDRIIEVFKMDIGNPITHSEYKISNVSSNDGTLPKGELLYSQYCASCHKNDGNGVTGTFPPLKGSKYLTGDNKALAALIENGLTDTIKSQSLDYQQSMPAFDFLSDEEVEQIILYIKTEFSNEMN